MIDPVVRLDVPVTLVGGGRVRRRELDLCLAAAPMVVAADGGADHLLHAGLRPLAVIGDMDSISAAARSVYHDILHPVAEQDTTDFVKCLTRMHAPLVLATGFLGGRLDHTLSALGALARLRAEHVVLVSRTDLCLLLPQGRSVWPLPPGLRIGVLPLGSARVSSRGLRWDLTDAPLAPDGLISSSNAVDASPVTIDVDGPVLLSVPPQALSVVMPTVRARRRD